MMTGLTVGLLVVHDRRRAAESALDQATAANRAKELALDAATAAGREKDEALRGEQLARAAERQGEYATRLALAYRAWAAGDMEAADRALDGCSPELRQWEFDYLRRLCHSERLVLGAGEKAPAYCAAFSPDGRL